MFDIIAANTVYIFGILGVLAFLVELIVQMTKELPFIKSIPTKLYAIIISLIICVLGLFVFSAWQNMTVLWYYIALAVIGSFIVAYLSIFGWDTMAELYNRYQKRGDDP